jgi:hypothetical protein
MIRWYDRFATLDKGQAHDRPSENYVDDVYAFFQNCYHLKDWIKNDPSLSISSVDIENFINGSASLLLCADLCNSLKHLSLTRPRSSKNPTFGPKQYGLTLGGGAPTIRLKYQIDTSTGPIDAFTLATNCVNEWKTFFAAKGLSIPYAQGTMTN